MTTSEQINELATALAKAQSEMANAVKDSLNPFFKNKYPDLASVRAACLPALTKHGIAVVQSPEIVNQADVVLETRLIHSSGQWVSGTVSCGAKDNSPQAIGSAITYLRRYALQSFTCVAAEDDDGEAAQGRPKMESAKVSTKPKGFDDALKLLNTAADGGEATLKSTWAKVDQPIRDYLMETDVKTWTHLKNHAVGQDRLFASESK